jgi:hypothetical protein
MIEVLLVSAPGNRRSSLAVDISSDTHHFHHQLGQMFWNMSHLASNTVKFPRISKCDTMSES